MSVTLLMFAQWTTLDPRKWWPSSRAHLRAPMWQSCPSSRYPSSKCQNVGQFYCGKCLEPLRELARSNVRRTLQLARLRAVNDVCSRSGMKPSALSVEEIRGGQTADLSARGLLSLDAEGTQGAKKQLKSAVKLGYSGILDMFTKDVAFALRSTERGLTRSAMLVQDVLATAVLPNPGGGSQASMTYGAGSTAAITARLLYLRRPFCCIAQGRTRFKHDRQPDCHLLAWCRVFHHGFLCHHRGHEPGQLLGYLRPIHCDMGS